MHDNVFLSYKHKQGGFYIWMCIVLRQSVTIVCTYKKVSKFHLPMVFFLCWNEFILVIPSSYLLCKIETHITYTIVWEKFDAKNFLPLVWHNENWMHRILLTIADVFYSLESSRDENILPRTNFTRKYPKVNFFQTTVVQNFDGQKLWHFWHFTAWPSKFNPSNCLKTIQRLQVYGERQWPSVKISPVKILHYMVRT